MINNAIVLLFSASVSMTAALVPSKPWTTQSPQRVASSSKPKWTAYFDDVSRHSHRWKRPPAPLASSSSQRLYNIQPATKLPTPLDRSEKNHETMRRLLLGYDAVSASGLSTDQVSQQMKLWADKSSVVGDDLGEEMYRDTLGTTVCDATNTVGCMAQFWQTIATVIEENTDECNPTLWKTPPFKDKNPASSKRSRNILSANQIYFTVFPYCDELYDYKTMCTFIAAMEFSKEMCLFLGNRFSLTLFHPKFKNSPRMLSPERHSPFPASGLQFGEPPHLPVSAGDEPEDERASGKFKRKLDRPNDDKGFSVKSRIRDLDARRKHFEALFNSAAVSGSDQGDGVESMHDFISDDVVDSISNSVEHERQIQRRNLPESKVKDTLQTWIGRNRFADDARRLPNQALKFVDTVAEERWSFSQHEIAEKVFADIWRAISDLNDIGRQADKGHDAGLTQDDSPLQELSDFNQLDQIKTFSQPFLSKRSVDDEHQLQKVEPVIVSSMFVPTTFCAYNAQSFKRFAIVINAALRRLTGGQMFLEVFHPEYVGRKECNSAMRRSPVPMILIGYETKAENVVE